MNKYLAIKVLLTCIFALLLGTTSFADEYYSRDPKVTYDKKYPDSNFIVEVPGHKLDPQSALAIEIGKAEREYAASIDPGVLHVATGYIKYAELSFGDEFSLDAAKDLGNYILLDFTEPGVMDGGFELVYSKELKNIIDMFSAGIKG